MAGSRKWPREKLVQSFWARVTVRGEDECWLWTGKRDNRGYGKMCDGKVRAHRFSYELAHGPIPAGHVIRHRCDTPSCVNPRHLLDGTQADNVRDMEDRQRRFRARQEWRQGYTKLTADEVRRIRAEHGIVGTRREVAKAYGIAMQTLDGIIARRIWRDV